MSFCKNRLTKALPDSLRGWALLITRYQPPPSSSPTVTSAKGKSDKQQPVRLRQQPHPSLHFESQKLRLLPLSFPPSNLVQQLRRKNISSSSLKPLLWLRAPLGQEPLISEECKQQGSGLLLLRV